jgi:hypothetical protein
MTQKIEIIDRATGITIIKGPTFVLPRKGDTIMQSPVNHKYIVDEVVFDFQVTNRRGIGEKADLVIRIYASRL